MECSDEGEADFRRRFDKLQRKRAGHGIKALVPTGVLISLIRAAKKHCAICKVQLDAAMPEPHPQCATCKLRVNIGTSEAIFKKFDTRNRIAFESRERRRAQEARAEESEQGAEWHPPEFVPPTIDISKRPTRW